MYNGDASQALIDATYRTHARPVYATLVRLLGDRDLAEDSLLEAFTAAVEQWPREGMPKNPRSWLVSAGRFKAIDMLRRRARFQAVLPTLAESQQRHQDTPDTGFADEHLRLIFTCCHPILSQEAQVALTLREVCGLTTEAIASAFLVLTATLAQRIVRARARLRDAGIRMPMPELEDVPQRIQAVLQVIYLIFNEGYNASSGGSLIRADLCTEAIRLGRVLVTLHPEVEVQGLLALMLLQDSRRAARLSPEGEIVLLEDQDRALWNRAQISEGIGLVERALATGSAGYYSLQAAIAAVHAEAPDAASTDWAQIVALYMLLHQRFPSPVIALNRAVAVAMWKGAEVGLSWLEELFQEGALTQYSPAWIARAELLRRAGRTAEARCAYVSALCLPLPEPERRFLQRRLDALEIQQTFV